LDEVEGRHFLQTAKRAQFPGWAFVDHPGALEMALPRCSVFHEAYPDVSELHARSESCGE
jgi:hypothetical protein